MASTMVLSLGSLCQVPTGLEGLDFLGCEIHSPPHLITGVPEVRTRDVRFSLPQGPGLLPRKGSPRARDSGPQRGLHRRVLEPEGKKTGSGSRREERPRCVEWGMERRKVSVGRQEEREN